MRGNVAGRLLATFRRPRGEIAFRFEVSSRIDGPIWMWLRGLQTLIFLAIVAGGQSFGHAATQISLHKQINVPSGHVEQIRLAAGDTIEILVRVDQPSELPANVRLKVSWSLVSADNPTRIPRAAAEHQEPHRKTNAFGIYNDPTANWSKLLHGLDPDVYVVYRAPVFGVYELRIEPEEGEIDLFDRPRWREKGVVAEVTAASKKVLWPENSVVSVVFGIEVLDVSETKTVGVLLETEPNDTPEQGQNIVLNEQDVGTPVHVFGASDDIEYFDNGYLGAGGDDWFRIEYQGNEPRLLAACLLIPDQQVVARIRAYRIVPEHTAASRAWPLNASLLPLEKYEEGKNANERPHQQSDEEEYRTAINRQLDPGGIYFLRVEANSPAYELQLCVVEPAPYEDPRESVRRGLYDHIGQVDAWLTNRPRDAAVERRIRDSGNLLGTNCMSCHTQSGVWGPSVPFANGYRPQNTQMWQHLVNTCYQSMRPTNELENAANNTSLQPLDVGDGPAGTRVAGHSVVTLERYLPARRLQSSQAVRAANYVLQTADPGGINAAGPGANVGQGVVFNYAGEVLKAAWEQTGEPKYFHALEEKVSKVLEIEVKFTDDLCHRVELIYRFFPRDYVVAAARVAEQEKLTRQDRLATMAAAGKLDEQIKKQVEHDLKRLRAIQKEDGSWGFNPGKWDDAKQTWVAQEGKPDPSPTALAIIAFQTAGIGRDDPVVSRAIQALLAQQHPTGYWNGESNTGFVSTSYALHALSRYFPVEPPHFSLAEFQQPDEETLVAAIGRVRRLSLTNDPRFVPRLVEAAGHDSPLVRYWAMLGLAFPGHNGAIAPLIEGLGDSTKIVREAAHWALRQQLIDDRGWDQVLEAASKGDDTTREAAIRTLVMKVDGVMTGSSIEWNRLVSVLDHAMNDDPNPAVRAWATRAAWQWWIWNPPTRAGLNTAWLRLLGRPEPNALVENAIRYQSHALLVANGHVGNGSEKHQYQELADLVAMLGDVQKQNKNDPQTDLLTSRLLGVAATYYSFRGSDGGPGQLGYVTPGLGQLLGQIALARLEAAQQQSTEPQQELLTRFVLEGAANIPHDLLQEKLIEYSLHGPESLRSLAASSVSDPRLVQLAAVAEQLEPMHRILLRGAADPPRRESLSDPILKLLGGVKWVLSRTVEQRQNILRYLVPDTSNWQSPEAIETVQDAATKQQAQRDADAAWYLANGLGKAVRKNPDLHFEQLAFALPREFDNGATARFWIRNIPWILTFQQDLPAIKSDSRELPPIDPFEELRSRALHLFTGQIGPSVLAANRELAVELANQTALRRNPEVLTALAELESFEKDEKTLEYARNVLSQERGSFAKQLGEVVQKKASHLFPTGDDGQSMIPEPFLEDITFFRDYVVPEMTRVLRGDERSCMHCHGEPGRVPSMELHRPDKVGYLPVDQLLDNYATLQHRVKLSDVEQSKFLRKPLNIQTGQEDGHQGGRRYQPMDPGYQIIRKWVLNQVDLQKQFGPVRPVAN